MKWFQCCYCKKSKAEIYFYKDKSTKTGHKPRCKMCEKLYIDKEKRRAYEKIYRTNNLLKRYLIVKKSMTKNKEHHKQKRIEYLQTEQGKISYKKYTQKRYALKKALIVEDINIKAIYADAQGKCFYCHKNITFDEIHIDHFIPVSKGGQHIKSNLRISCKKCNLSKGNKMPEQWEAYYQMVPT